MATAKKDGKWRDASQEWIPVKYIDKFVKERDKMVEKHLKTAVKLRKDLAKFKAAVEADIEKYWEKEREEYGRDSSNPGQNKKFENFASDLRIDCQSTQAIDFDDRVWIARDKLFEYVEHASQGGKDIEGLKIIVKNAYATNRYGKLDRQRILSLLALGDKIKHPAVQEACKIINECIQRLDRKVYIRFAEKSKGGDWEYVNLNFTSV